MYMIYKILHIGKLSPSSSLAQLSFTTPPPPKKSRETFNLSNRGGGLERKDIINKGEFLGIKVG